MMFVFFSVQCVGRPFPAPSSTRQLPKRTSKLLFLLLAFVSYRNKQILSPRLPVVACSSLLNTSSRFNTSYSSHLIVDPSSLELVLSLPSACLPQNLLLSLCPTATVTAILFFSKAFSANIRQIFNTVMVI